MFSISKFNQNLKTDNPLLLEIFPMNISTFAQFNTAYCQRKSTLSRVKQARKISLKTMTKIIECWGKLIKKY